MTGPRASLREARLRACSQVVAFVSRHLGSPFATPALFKQPGDRFRYPVAGCADRSSRKRDQVR
ncbi:hypothetical protein E1292_45595 [Nonomuraea deserti]|uniref:Uncharacterized protein n=1 Tax=Nonomuraea deserti TaxID=1848322 RepID=A0A4R4UAH5_9ACTN|nr:hypothetical protein E1292_45595 [Nonomuraea deserti]